MQFFSWLFCVRPSPKKYLHKTHTFLPFHNKFNGKFMARYFPTAAAIAPAQNKGIDFFPFLPGFSLLSYSSANEHRKKLEEGGAAAFIPGFFSLVFVVVCLGLFSSWLPTRSGTATSFGMKYFCNFFPVKFLWWIARSYFGRRAFFSLGNFPF